MKTKKPRARTMKSLRADPMFRQVIIDAREREKRSRDAHGDTLDFALLVADEVMRHLAVRGLLE